MKYKVSIIIPVYNVELYLEKCLFSLFAQSLGFENLEIILVDDCSTDRSKQIISAYDNVYENIKGVFLNKNSGVAGKPRNVGMEYATSDYLIFLDPDDVLKEDACEILFNKIEDENADIVTGVHSIIDNDDEVIFPGLLINSFTNPLDTWKDRQRDFDNVFRDEMKFSSIKDMEYFLGNFGLSSKIFRRKFIEKHTIKFPEYIPGEDSVFLFNSLINARGIVFLNKIIYVYNNSRNDENNNSLSFQKDLKRNLGRLDAYLIMLNISKEKDMLYPFVQYLLKSKLVYFTNNFLVGNDLSYDEMLEILKKAQPLFSESYDFDVNVTNFKLLFDLLNIKKYDEAIKYISSIKKSDNSINNISKVNKRLKQKNIKVALIMDAFTYNSYKDEFIPIILEPHNWLESFEKNQPDIFFCESAYHGFFKDEMVDGITVESKHDGPWFKKIGVNYNTKKEFRNELFKILDYCNKHNIPTVFWNKEDPTSFNNQDYNFIDTALRFDYIFTTSEECISKYNSRGHYNVYPLMFASNLKLFNPIHNETRKDDLIVFAGSWYKQFEERCNVMVDFFDKILESNFDLKIYDRAYGKNWSNRIFPRKYTNYIYPAVPFNKMSEVYKESKFGLNINTVVDSYTMFARRIFELMSSNTFVISNFSKGIYDIFKNNVIYLDKLDKLDFNNLDIDNIIEDNLYNVLENHNYTKRFQYILDSINFDYQKEYANVTIFYNLTKSTKIEDIKKHFSSIQYPFKNLIVVIDNERGNRNIYNKLEKEDILFILKKDLLSLKDDFNDNDFFIFADVSVNKDFIKKSLLHYQYLSKNFGIRFDEYDKFMFSTTNTLDNVIFNGNLFENVIGQYLNDDLLVDIYLI